MYYFRSGLGQTPVRHEVLRREEQRRCSGFLQGSELRPDKPDHPVHVNRHESGATDRRLRARHPRGVRCGYVSAHLLTFLSASNKTRRLFQSKASRSPGEGASDEVLSCSHFGIPSYKEIDTIEHITFLQLRMRAIKNLEFTT